jgi:hypothetical protein
MSLEAAKYNLTQSDLMDALDLLLSELPPQDEMILRMGFGLSVASDHKPVFLSDAMGITKVRVDLIESKAVSGYQKLIRSKSKPRVCKEDVKIYKKGWKPRNLWRVLTDINLTPTAFERLLYLSKFLKSWGITFYEFVCSWTWYSEFIRDSKKSELWLAELLLKEAKPCKYADYKIITKLLSCLESVGYIEDPSTDDPFEFLHTKELSSIINKELSMLPPNYYSVLNYKIGLEEDAKSFQEIANIMGMTVPKTEALYQKAASQFKHRLLRQGVEPEILRGNFSESMKEVVERLKIRAMKLKRKALNKHVYVPIPIKKSYRKPKPPMWTTKVIHLIRSLKQQNLVISTGANLRLLAGHRVRVSPSLVEICQLGDRFFLDSDSPIANSLTSWGALLPKYPGRPSLIKFIEPGNFPGIGCSFGCHIPVEIMFYNRNGTVVYNIVIDRHGTGTISMSQALASLSNLIKTIDNINSIKTWDTESIGRLRTEHEKRLTKGIGTREKLR